MSKNFVDAASAAETKPTKTEEFKPKRRQFSIWTVGDRDIKLKLKTSAVVELENKYKQNLLSIMGEGEGGMPALVVMLDIVYAAAKDWNHGLKKNEVYDLYDQYLDEGGSMLKFYTNVFMDVFLVSGFFSEALAEQMTEMADELEM